MILKNKISIIIKQNNLLLISKTKQTRFHVNYLSSIGINYLSSISMNY